MSPDELLHTGPGALPVAIAVGCANFLTILAVLRALSPKDLISARARSHAKRRRELRGALQTPRRASRARSVGWARQLIARLKLSRGREAREAADLMVQAGWRSSDATAVFLALRLVMPLAMGVIAYLVAPLVLTKAGDTIRALVAVGGIGTGAYPPKLLLRNVIQKRGQKILKALPDGRQLRFANAARPEALAEPNIRS